MAPVVRDQYGVVTVQSKDDKHIRFITPDYREKFTIPDGGQILVSYANGEKRAFVCKHLDDHHLLVGRNAYHICEFAQRLAQIGASVQPFPEKRMIWQDIDLDLKDWDFLREEYPDCNEDQLWQLMHEQNNAYLADEHITLDIQCGTDIIVFGDIGRWNGRVSGYQIITSGNIKDCLYSDCDMVEWYVDREGEFRSRQIHHDGTNYLYYRKFREGLSKEDRQDFLDKVYDGTATQGDIDRATEKLGRTIAQVYGWELPTEKERVSQRDAR